MLIIKEQGSVRVDLLGGTLDIWPINLIIPHAVTLNVATTLKAQVELKEISFKGIEIISHDFSFQKMIPQEELTFENLYQNKTFGPLTFVLQILDLFQVKKGLSVSLASDAPAGSGLGGSSAMGVTLFKALTRFYKKHCSPLEIITQVKDVEARILECGPAGYQDYYPALHGGILGLVPQAGHVELRQLFSPSLKKFLEDHLTLIYSGEQRHSGINNWEVYKGFFDKDSRIRQGLTQIASLSYEALKEIEANHHEQLPPLIKAEGRVRRELFPTIMTPSMDQCVKELSQLIPSLGVKVCGAGGGGCFLLTHGVGDRKTLSPVIERLGMRILPFEIDPPLPSSV